MRHSHTAERARPMSFHFGKPILVMLVLSVTGGILLALWPGRPKNTDLVAWVSAEAHVRTYAEGDDHGTPSLVEQFRLRTGKTVDVKLLSTRAEDVRLVSMFMSDS